MMSGPDWTPDGPLAAALARRGWAPVPASGSSKLDALLKSSLKVALDSISGSSAPISIHLKQDIGKAAAAKLPSLYQTVHYTSIKAALVRNNDETFSINTDQLHPMVLLGLISDFYRVRVDFLNVQYSEELKNMISVRHHTFLPDSIDELPLSARARIGLLCANDQFWHGVVPASITCFPATFPLKRPTEAPVGVISASPELAPLVQVRLSFGATEHFLCELCPLATTSTDAKSERLYAFVPPWRRLGSTADVAVINQNGESRACHPIFFDVSPLQSAAGSMPLRDALDDMVSRGAYRIAARVQDSLVLQYTAVPLPDSKELKVSAHDPLRASVSIKGFKTGISFTKAHDTFENAAKDFVRFANETSLRVTKCAARYKIVLPPSERAVFDMTFLISLLSTEKRVLVIPPCTEVELRLMAHIKQLTVFSAFDIATKNVSENSLMVTSKLAVTLSQEQLPMCTCCTPELLPSLFPLFRNAFGAIIDLRGMQRADKIAPIAKLPLEVGTKYFEISTVLPSPKPLALVKSIPCFTLHQFNYLKAVSDKLMKVIGLKALSTFDIAWIDQTFKVLKQCNPDARCAIISEQPAGLIGNGFQTLEGTNQIYEAIGTKDVPNVALIILAHSDKSTTATLRPLLELATRPNAALPVLIVAALPPYWPELDYIASFSQIPTLMYAPDAEGGSEGRKTTSPGEVSEYTSAFSELKFSNTSLLPPAILSLALPRASSAMQTKWEEDAMDVDQEGLDNADALEPPHAKRRKSTPEPSIPRALFPERVSKKSSGGASSTPRSVRRDSTPGKSSAKSTSTPSSPTPRRQSVSIDTDFVPPGTKPSVPKRSERSERAAEKQKAEKYSAHDSVPKEKSTSTKSGSSDHSSSGYTSQRVVPAMPPTGAIIERQESLIIESLSATKRNTLFRSIKTFLLRYGFAPFGVKIDHYATLFKFNSIRFFRELIIDVAHRLGKASPQVCDEFLRGPLQMDDTEVEVCHTITRILLVMKYMEKDTEELQSRAAAIVGKAWVPQQPKPRWWNGKMEIRALMWLWANGCPATWHTELDRTWVHEDFQSDHSGTETMPSDWKSIAKDLDTHFQPPAALAKRFFELLKFLLSRNLLNAAATKAADILLAKDGPVDMSSLELPSPPKRTRHWLLAPDEVISSEPEMRPAFWLEIAAQLALRYSDDYESMNSYVLKDHPIDVLRHCGKSSGSEHLAAGTTIVRRLWPEIKQAAATRQPLPILGLDMLEVRFIAKLSKLREGVAPLWKDESRTDLRFSDITALGKSLGFRQWANEVSSTGFPTPTDLILMMAYCCKYGVPTTPATETLFLETIVGSRNSENDWRYKYKLDDGQGPDSPHSAATMFNSWMKRMQNGGKLDKRDLLVSVFSRFVRKLPYFMCDIFLVDEAILSLWKENVLRLGCNWDEDDLEDVAYDCNIRDVHVQLNDLQRCNGWAYNLISDVLDSPQSSTGPIQLHSGDISLKEAERIRVVTKAREARKDMVMAKKWVSSKKLHEMLWVVNKDMIDDSNLKELAELFCSSATEVASTSTSVQVQPFPLLAELSLLAVLMEYGVPNNFKTFSKVLASVLGEDGRSQRGGPAFSRHSSVVDVGRRVREMDRALISYFSGVDTSTDEKAKRGSGSPALKAYLSAIFSGEGLNKLESLLENLGADALAAHLFKFSEVLTSEPEEEQDQEKDTIIKDEEDSSVSQAAGFALKTPKAKEKEESSATSSKKRKRE